jgi:hypothetical protein
MRLTRRTVLPVPARSAFAGFRFPREVIVLAVRWYLRFGLSYPDVEELLARAGHRGRPRDGAPVGAIAKVTDQGQ